MCVEHANQDGPHGEGNATRSGAAEAVVERAIGQHYGENLLQTLEPPLRLVQMALSGAREGFRIRRCRQGLHGKAGFDQLAQLRRVQAKTA